MALTAQLISLGDHSGERGITEATAIQSPAVFNFMVVVDGKPLSYNYTNNVGCNWNFGDAGALNVKYGPRAGQSTNTMFGAAQATKTYRVPLEGGVQSFDVNVVVKNELGEEIQLTKTVWVKAADHGKTVVAYSPTLDINTPAAWVGVPAGANLLNGVPGYRDFTDKLVMFEGGVTHLGNNTAQDIMQIAIDQTNFAVTSFNGRATLPELMVGARFSTGGGVAHQYLKSADVAGPTLKDANISKIRTASVRSPMVYDDLTYVDIDSDYSLDEVTPRAGFFGVLAYWNAAYLSSDLQVHEIKFAQKLFVAESVFKGMNIRQLNHNSGQAQDNIYDFTDDTGRTVTTYSIDGGAAINAGVTTSIPNVGDLRIDADGTYAFTSVSGWDRTNNKVKISVVDNVETSKFSLGSWLPGNNVSGINVNVMNVVFSDVQVANPQEHNFRLMGNWFQVVQDCDAQGGHSSAFKHCFSMRSVEFASPTVTPTGPTLSLGTTNIPWFGGQSRSFDANGFRVLAGMKYGTRQHNKSYVDNSVRATVPAGYSSSVKSGQGQGNPETGVKYCLDYNMHFDWEDPSESMAEYLATSNTPEIGDISDLTVVKTTTNRTAGPNVYYADSTSSIVDHSGDMPLASLPGGIPDEEVEDPGTDPVTPIDPVTTITNRVNQIVFNLSNQIDTQLDSTQIINELSNESLVNGLSNQIARRVFSQLSSRIASQVISEMLPQ